MKNKIIIGLLILMSIGFASATGDWLSPQDVTTYGSWQPYLHNHHTQTYYTPVDMGYFRSYYYYNYYDSWWRSNYYAPSYYTYSYYPVNLGYTGRPIEK
jgi:hypothetical protein